MHLYPFRYLALCLIFVFFGCERLIIDDGFSEEPEENFDYLWSEVNDHYAFFELKKVDWDSVYSVYRPRVSPTTSTIELFTICSEMLNELRDGHVNLSSDFNVSRYNFNATTQKNFSLKLLQDNYIGYDYFTTGALVNQFLENGEVGYIRYGSFLNDIETYDLNFVFQRFRNTKSLILDLRSNFGGSQGNVEQLIGGFINGKRPELYSLLKTGSGKNDFSQPEPYTFHSVVDQPYTKPVMVLINRESFSATSFFSTLARQLDQVTLVGDTTGGGMGVPTGGELPNGWNYRFSGSKTLDHEGNNFENGVPPDIYVIQDVNDFFNGEDTILERALQELGF